MHAAIGDRITLKNKIEGMRQHIAEIVEVLGANGTPPYRVRFDDGHEAVLNPGLNTTIEHRSSMDTMPGLSDDFDD
ncbi:DUF1918 domain-containing protein [Pendulispora albinea]|uniref:DUF1918 domain-containing protein n=1 Tax=Pendulispora albinea TaxID=2741071 RepID=A0ABZ2MBX0_9BACT